MTDAFVRGLRRAVGAENVLDHGRDLLTYAYDAALTRHAPEVVVLPATTEQVQEVVRLAGKARVPVTVRGAGTSLSGGPVPVEGGVALVLTRMNQILEVDLPNRCVRAQAGVINDALQKALAPHGYLYAPDPASQTVATLGGNVGMNAGGPHCLKYGVTVNHVLGLRVVTADGELMDMGGEVPTWHGLDVTGLIVGSEGTLGIVTEMALSILPKPEAVTTMLAVFEDVEQASKAASEITAAGIIPAALELMDRPLIDAVQRSLDAGYPRDAGAVLIIEVDGLEASAQREITEIQQVCRMHDVLRFDSAQDEEARALLWRGRKGVTGAVAHIAPSKLCSDITVPRHALGLVVNEIIRIGERRKLSVGSLVHAGDGNLHPQVMFDPRDRFELNRALAADDEITQLAMDVGGVLTGEHGIGTQKRKWMTRMFGPAELRMMRDIKGLLDPAGLLNPGKVLPEDVGDLRPAELDLPRGDFDAAVTDLAWRTEGLLTPPHEVEFAKLLAVAARQNVRVRIRGGGTASHAVPNQTAVVSTQALDHLAEHDHTNLTVTAGAGTRLGELQGMVGDEDQVVPLFPPEPEAATLGGVVAADDQGPRGLGYGRCRDLVTGMTVALTTGELLTLGGKCVKDVAGYDLKKLFIGSRGALGAIVDVTIRTFPLPEQRRSLVFPAADTDAVTEAATEILASGLRITVLEAVDGSSLLQLCASPDLKRLGQLGWAFALETAGIAEDVEETTVRVYELSARAGLPQPEELDPDAAYELWNAVGSLRGGVPPEHIAATISVPPAETMLAGVRVRELAAHCGLVLLVRASPASGQLRLRVLGQGNPKQLEALTEGLQDIAYDLPGSLRTTGLPFQPDESPVTLLSQEIKQLFDPAGVLPPLPGVAM